MENLLKKGLIAYDQGSSFVPTPKEAGEYILTQSCLLCNAMSQIYKIFFDENNF